LGSRRKIAIRASSHRRVMAPDKSVGASARKAKSQREGRKAHTGHSLMQVESHDEVVHHRHMICGSESFPIGKDRWADQGMHACIQDLPQVQLVVHEYQVEETSCPACQHTSVGSFSAGVEAPGKSGANLDTFSPKLIHRVAQPTVTAATMTSARGFGILGVSTCHRCIEYLVFGLFDCGVGEIDCRRRIVLG